MSIMKPFLKFKFILCLIAISITACQRDSAKLAEAKEAIRNGNTEKAIELLTPIAESPDSPESADANMDLAMIFSESGDKNKAHDHIVVAAEKGNMDAVIIAVDGCLKGNEEYGFTKSDIGAMQLIEKLRAANSQCANNDSLNERLVKLYLFSPECRNPIKAADIIMKQQCSNWQDYRAILKYMGAGGVPQDIKGASELLNRDPLPETAVYMGHLAVLALLEDGDYPENKLMLALKYYNIALNESEYVDKQAIFEIVGILSEFLNQFNARTLSPGYYQINKRTISGGWNEYSNNGFDYCGGIANGYPNGYGVGSHEYQDVYCGNWKNGRFNRLGVLYNLKGEIVYGFWSGDEISNWTNISPKGEVSRF